MYIDAGEVVRVRVEADEFYDDEPGPPKATEGVMANGQAKERENRRAPYTITVRAFALFGVSLAHFLCSQGSIAEQGLGPVPWWQNAGMEAMDEG